LGFFNSARSAAICQTKMFDYTSVCLSHSKQVTICIAETSPHVDREDSIECLLAARLRGQDCAIARLTRGEISLNAVTASAFFPSLGKPHQFLVRKERVSRVFRAGDCSLIDLLRRCRRFEKSTSSSASR